MSLASFESRFNNTNSVQKLITPRKILPSVHKYGNITTLQPSQGSGSETQTISPPSTAGQQLGNVVNNTASSTTVIVLGILILTMICIIVWFLYNQFPSFFGGTTSHTMQTVYKGFNLTGRRKCSSSPFTK